MAAAGCLVAAAPGQVEALLGNLVVSPEPPGLVASDLYIKRLKRDFNAIAAAELCLSE